MSRVFQFRRSPASFSLAAASTWPCGRTPPWIFQRCPQSQSLRDRTGMGVGVGEGYSYWSPDSCPSQRCQPFHTCLDCSEATIGAGALVTGCAKKSSVWYPPPFGQGLHPVAGPPPPGASAFPGEGSHWSLSCCSCWWGSGWGPHHQPQCPAPTHSLSCPGKP